jgi:hypothetical protein
MLVPGGHAPEACVQVCALRQPLSVSRAQAEHAQHCRLPGHTQRTILHAACLSCRHSGGLELLFGDRKEVAVDVPSDASGQARACCASCGRWAAGCRMPGPQRRGTDAGHARRPPPVTCAHTPTRTHAQHMHTHALATADGGAAAALGARQPAPGAARAVHEGGHRVSARCVCVRARVRAGLARRVCSAWGVQRPRAAPATAMPHTCARAAAAAAAAGRGPPGGLASSC